MMTAVFSENNKYSTLFKTHAIILKMVNPQWARVNFERTTEVNLLLQLFIPLCALSTWMLIFPSLASPAMLRE